MVRDVDRIVQLQFMTMMMKKAHGLLGIEMRHLVAFEAVAATGSFARAAEQLGYTQSAVSLQIAALERAAGTRLLDRPGGRKAVVPTDAGTRMLRHAVRLSAQLQAAEADLTALAEGTANTLRVGTFQSVSIRVLPDAVRVLLRERPGITSCSAWSTAAGST
jgi:DNA-binding transcriptional LysR family regulator